jgi:hypothetical protein
VDLSFVVYLKLQDKWNAEEEEIQDENHEIVVLSVLLVLSVDDFAQDDVIMDFAVELDVDHDHYVLQSVRLVI